MDIINRRKNDQKKCLSMATVEVQAGDLEAGAVSKALMLPSRCVLNEVYAVCETDHDGGDILIESVDEDGVVDGVLNVTSVQTVAGVEADLLAASLPTDKGMTIQVTATNDVTAGLIQLVFKYDEPTLSTGKLTRVR